MGMGSDTGGFGGLQGSSPITEEVIGGSSSLGGGSGGGGILGALGGILGGGSSSGQSGGGSNQSLLNTVLGELLKKQQPTGFGGSFVGGPGIASGRAQAPAFGPPAIAGAGSPLERLAIAMASLR